LTHTCSHKEIIIPHYNNQLSILRNQSHMSFLQLTDVLWHKRVYLGLVVYCRSIW